MLLRRILLAVVAGMLIAVPAAGAHSHHGCANANRSVFGTPASVLRGAVVCLVNQQRTERGLPPLHASRLLDRSAQAWTNWMTRNGEVTHGQNFSGRISAVGYSWSWVGENIAAGFGTPASVVRGWMGSYGHCQNILSPQYYNVGTGVSARRTGPYGGGTWTQDFALPMGHSTPSGNWGPANRCPY